MEEFIEIEIIDEEMSLLELLDSGSILLFIDPKQKRVWMWIGRSSSTRMRVAATQDLHHKRDLYAYGFQISFVDEDYEDKGFNIFLGLKKEEDESEGTVEPLYKGDPEELKIFESMSEEEILLILKKAEVPKGYERRMVIANKEIYLYKEFDHSLGSDIKQSRLFHLKEDIEDGPYLLENCTPRPLFSLNKIVLVDVLYRTKVEMS